MAMDALNLKSSVNRYDKGLFDRCRLVGGVQPLIIAQHNIVLDFPLWMLATE